MDKQLAELIENIKADYSDWWSAKGEVSEIQQKMISEFHGSVTAKAGRNYIKVITDNSVWGFIVNTDTDKKFSKGDILKAANWSSPARNQARGNILDGGYQIKWTGPNYL